MPAPREYPENKSGWLITFADMVTLLLALFVLMFSMSSLDSAVIQSISSSISRDMPKRDLNRGKITEEIREVAQLLADTGMAHTHEGRIKELLFPQDLLPPAIDKGTLDTSLRLVENAEGVAFVLGDNLLFKSEGVRIADEGRLILNSMVPLFELMGSDVQISAFYGGPPVGELQDDYAVAARRALAVLGVFINQGVKTDKLSISAYGADRAATAAPLENMPLNRVEILLKTGLKALEGE